MEWDTKEVDQDEANKANLLGDWMILKERNPEYCLAQNEYVISNWDREKAAEKRRERENRSNQRALEAVQTDFTWLSQILAWIPCI